MITIIPNVPSNCNVFGELYWDSDLTILGEDMVDVLLPNGVLVSCGWYPESDPAGRYVVNVTNGFEQLLSVETTDVSDARSLIESLARDFGGNAIFVSETDSAESESLLLACA